MEKRNLRDYKEYAEKKMAVRELSVLLSKYVSNVEFIDYHYYEAVHEEWVVIHFVGGGKCALCETATSVLAIMQDIVNNVMHADYSHLETFRRMNEKYVDVLADEENEKEKEEEVNYDSCGNCRD